MSTEMGKMHLRKHELTYQMTDNQIPDNKTKVKIAIKHKNENILSSSAHKSFPKNHFSIILPYSSLFSKLPLSNISITLPYSMQISCCP